MRAGDVLVVASNSGGNAVVGELAALARARGVPVIAIVSRAHATSKASRSAGGPNLQDIADVVIDNGGAIGDAAVGIEGFGNRVGPDVDRRRRRDRSTRSSAEAVERLVARGIQPEVFRRATSTAATRRTPGCSTPGRRR